MANQLYGNLVLLPLFLIAAISNADGQCSVGEKVALRKSAFVVGMNNYQNDPLHNAVNDAVDIAGALYRLGFSPILDTNKSLEDLKFDIEKWTASLTNVDVALFYFSGHGSQIGKDNLIYPISADPWEKNERLVRQSTYNASTLVSRMQNYNKHLNVVILDACRQDPTKGVVSSFIRKGLGPVKEIGKGVLVSFPVASGQRTPEGVGRNSLFARALLENIEIPNLSIIQIFERVHDYVVENSNDELSPYIDTSIGAKSDFCLKIFDDGRRKSGEELKIPDTSVSLEIQRYRSIVVDTAYKSVFRRDTAMFEQARRVIERSIEAVWDSIKNVCDCEVGNRGNSVEIQKHFFTNRTGFVNPILGYLFYPTFTGEVRSNKFIFTIFGETWTWKRLEKFEIDNGLKNTTVFEESIFNPRWNVIENAVKDYLFKRLEMITHN